MAASTTPRTRFSFAREAREVYRAMSAFGRSVELDATVHELVEIRASQINGCAYCLDLHTHTAREKGESERRLHVLAAWRESPLFSERERAALALTEAITLLPQAGVPDEVYDAAAQHFTTAELAQLISAIAVINSWNRLMVASGAVYEAPEDRDQR